MTDDYLNSNPSPLFNHTILNMLSYGYLNWSGRLSSWFLECLFFNKEFNFISVIIINIMNAFVFVLFYRCIYNLVYFNQKKESLFHTLFFICSFTSILVLSAFLKSALWKTASVEYFWGIYLIFLGFEKSLQYKNSTKLNNFLFALAGIFIGLYNEIFFGTIILIYSLSWCYFILFQYRILEFIKSKRMTFFMSGLLIGGAILVAAPGNYARQKFIDGGHPVSLINKAFIFLQNFKHAYRIDLLILIFFCSILIQFIFKKFELKLYSFQILSVFASLIIFLPVSNFGFQSDRIFMFASTIIFCLSYINFLNILPNLIQLKNKFIPWCNNKIINVTLIMLIFFISFLNLRAYYRLFLFSQQRENEIAFFKSQQIENPEFTAWKPTRIDRSLVTFADIEFDSTCWQNKVYSTYYGFKSVKIK